MDKKPKINSAAGFGGFDDIEVEQKDSVQTGMEALTGKPAETAPRAIKGAAAGCKPGSSRKTYVFPEEVINKLKAISGHMGKSEVAIVLDMVEKGIADYEQRFGADVSKHYTMD